MIDIQLKSAKHRGNSIIVLDFRFDSDLVKLVKTIESAKWSQTMKSWYVPQSAEALNHLYQHFRGKARLIDVDLAPFQRKSRSASSWTGYAKLAHSLHPEIVGEIQKFTDWMRNKRYSESTIKTYRGGLHLFFRFLRNKPLEDIDNEDMERFNTEYIIAGKYSVSFQNQVINAVKLFFCNRQGRKLDPEIIYRPKKPKLLPNVLSKEEVKRILESHGNIKHRAMLSLIYACGLRRGELLNLKIGDIDSKRGLLLIRQGKGNKDRVIPLSQKIIELLREHYKYEKPNTFLFEGDIKGKRYSGTSLQKVLKSAVKKTGINKPVTLHWLRHSYATHLLENGTDLRYIQEILGHNSSRTTEIYTHVSTKSIQKIKSPFDDL